MYCSIQAAKTKALISFAVTAKLICVFVFAHAKSWFSHDEAHIIYHGKIWAATWENWILAYAKTKSQISCAVAVELISVFVFATWIDFLFFLNPKFQASSDLQWLSGPVCVREIISSLLAVVTHKQILILWPRKKTNVRGLINQAW